MANKQKLTYTLDLNNQEFVKALKDAGIDVKKLAKIIDLTVKQNKKSFSEMVSGVNDFAIGLNQGLELLKKVNGTIQAVNKSVIQFDKNVSLVEKRLDTTRKTAEKLTSQFQALSNVFEVDFNAQINAANALQKEFGLTAEQTFKLLEESAKKVPDQYDEIIQVTKEYSSQLSQIGISADQFLSISTQALQEGVFSDKGVDAIKEFNLSFREGTEATRLAFSGLGLDFDQLQSDVRRGSKTVFDVLTETSNRLKELGINAPATGLALADIFKGAGEDAGKFILELGNLKNSLSGVENQISEAQKAQLEFNKQIEIFTQNIIKATSPAIRFFNETLGASVVVLGKYFDEINKTNILDNFADQVEESGKSIEEFAKTLDDARIKSLIQFYTELSGSRGDQSLDFLGALNNELSLRNAGNIKTFFNNAVEGIKNFFTTTRQKAGTLGIPSIIDEGDEETEEVLFNINKIVNAAVEAALIQNEAEKALFDNQIERAKKLREITRTLYISLSEDVGRAIGNLFDVTLNSSEELSKAIGEIIKQSLISAIEAYKQAEIARALISAPLSFGATLAAIVPIVGAAEAGKAIISAIKFEDGGESTLQPGLLKGASHKNGGIKFFTKDQPGILKEAEGNEFFVDKITTARVGVDKLNALLAGRADIVPFQNGGVSSNTIINQPPANVSIGDQTITLILPDGTVIAELVNSANNNFTGSGGRIDKNT